jgi:hypothetical protein
MLDPTNSVPTLSAQVMSSLLKRRMSLKTCFEMLGSLKQDKMPQKKSLNVANIESKKYIVQGEYTKAF